MEYKTADLTMTVTLTLTEREVRILGHYASYNIVPDLMVKSKSFEEREVKALIDQLRDTLNLAEGRFNLTRHMFENGPRK